MSPRTRTPYLTSLSIHLLALVALILVRDQGEVSQATDTAPRTDARVVFLLDPGPGGGGGGGGNRQPEPPRRARAQGVDKTNMPVAPPSTFTPQPLQPVPVIETVAPLLSAVPTAASPDSAVGLIEANPATTISQGSGSNDDGAGTGSRRGAGPGPGDGIGDGMRQGTGGDVYQVGNGVTPPVLMRQVKPSYTREAMNVRMAGAAIVECVVTPDGTVTDVRIVRSLDKRYGLDEEALKAARLWRFRPATLHGKPVAVRITIELSFSIY